MFMLKMKSSTARYRRRFRAATFNVQDEPSIATSCCFSSSEAHSTNCHCHCPSSSGGVFENVDGVPSAWTPASCDLCERLRGRTGRECSDLVDAIRTEDVFVADDRPPRRRKRDGNEISSKSSDSRTTVELYDRTLRCDRVPACESTARCASSVVRWNLAVRFRNKSTEWRRILLWIVLLILTSVPDLAVAQQFRSAAIGPPRKDGGE